MLITTPRPSPGNGQGTPPGAGGRQRRRPASPVQSFLLQLAMALVGFVVASAAFGAPEAVRIPVALVAGLVGPGALFFRSFPAFSDLAVRAGASLAAVLASWTGWSTLVLGLGLGMSDRTVAVVLALVYTSGIVTFLALQAAAHAPGRRP